MRIDCTHPRANHQHGTPLAAHRLLLIACRLDNRGFTEDLHNHYSVECHRQNPVNVHAQRSPQEA